MKLKQLIIKLFNIEVSPIYIIRTTDYENSEIAPRASGRTTRLADHHVTEQMSRYLVGIIVRRLQIEHPRVCLDVRGNIITIERRNRPKFEW